MLAGCCFQWHSLRLHGSPSWPRRQVLTLAALISSCISPRTPGKLQQTRLRRRGVRGDAPKTLRAQVLGKFGVIMADPPWEIHQDLPYGTMADEEMRRMGLGALQDEGVIFLWVTGALAPAGHVGFQVIGCAPHGPGRAAGRGRHLPVGHRCVYSVKPCEGSGLRRMGLGALQDEGVIFLWVTSALAPAGHARG